MIRTFKAAHAVVLLCALSLGSDATAATKKVQTIPDIITTQKGKTYQSARLVSAEPDGLVIEYKPQTGGFGMTKLKFRDLPENLRQQFNYDEGAAAEFESARIEANANWRTRMIQTPQRPSAQQPAPAQNAVATQESIGMQAMQYPVGRFEAMGTIRGAMILDTVTGEAWLVDLHSVLLDYQQGPFALPKILLPGTQNPLVIGP